MIEFGFKPNCGGIDDQNKKNGDNRKWFWWVMGIMWIIRISGKCTKSAKKSSSPPQMQANHVRHSGKISPNATTVNEFKPYF